MSDKPVVLFLCIHNAGRSLAARVLLDHYAHGPIDVRSAGSEPADQLNPAVVAVLQSAARRRPRSTPSPSPTRWPGRRRHRHHGLRRHLPRLPGQALPRLGPPRPRRSALDAGPPIVDDIDRRVQTLLDELTRTDTP